MPPPVRSSAAAQSVGLGVGWLRRPRRAVAGAQAVGLGVGWLRRPRPAVAGAQAVGLGVGYLLDVVFADPRRGHPVAGFGRLAASLERRLWCDRITAGLVHVAVLVGAAGGVAALVTRRLEARPLALGVWTAAVTWSALGRTSLDREGAAMGEALAAGDLTVARSRLAHLCARDPSGLDAEALLRATVESLAENTADAVVGPLLWGALAGPAGVVAHRAANTLDAMVGYRTPRHGRFGAPAARLDDMVNLLPARLTAALVVLLAPLVGGDARAAVAVWRRDGGRHPSPNAGRVEAAFAGALGIGLGGEVNDYGAGDVQRRPQLGDGPGPTLADLDRTRRLARQVGVAAALLAVVGRGTWGGRGR